MIAKSFINWLFPHQERIVGNENHRILNLVKSPKDEKDFKLSVTAPALVLKAESYLPITWAFKIKNQGQIGSCASHAFATTTEIELMLNNPSKYLELSELFHYFVVRSPEFMNTFPNDTGQTLRAGVEVLYKVGISPEKLDPYDYTKFNQTPSFMAYSFARFWKIKRYEAVNGSYEAKVAISNKKAIAFGVAVDRAFLSNMNGRIVTPKGGTVGGHAMCIVGYNDNYPNEDGSKGAFHVVNSWGTNWGASGFCWMPYNYIDNQNLFYEAWTVYV